MIICGRSRAGTPLVDAATRQPFYLAGFRNFHLHALRAHPVRYRHSAKRGDTYGVTGDARPFKRGDYAATFAWTDGQMAACFERLKFSATP